MTPPEIRRCYLIRSARCIPLESGLVGIGWCDMPFKEYVDADALLDAMRNADWDLGRQSNQIRRFKDIRRGDLVVVPWWGTVAIGEATGEEIYDDNEPFYSQDGSNQHRVLFPRDAEGKVRLIARTDLSGALQNRLKIRITIADLAEFQDEIEDVYGKLCAGRAHSWMAQAEIKEAENREAAKRLLLTNIQSGRTGLAAGGLGLESLIRELLETDGFDAVGLGKQHFGSHSADADISAVKNHIFGAERFLIQAKHHWGDSDAWGVQQLLDIPEKFPEYADYQLVLITTGRLSPEGATLAEKHEVIVINGDKLVGWILDSASRLRRETRLSLGLMDVPAIFTR